MCEFGEEDEEVWVFFKVFYYFALPHCIAKDGFCYFYRRIYTKPTALPLAALLITVYLSTHHHPPAYGPLGLFRAPHSQIKVCLKMKCPFDERQYFLKEVSDILANICWRRIFWKKYIQFLKYFWVGRYVNNIILSMNFFSPVLD